MALAGILIATGCVSNSQQNPEPPQANPVQSKTIDGVTLRCKVVTFTPGNAWAQLEVGLTNASAHRIGFNLRQLLVWVKDLQGNDVPMTEKGEEEIGFWTKPLTHPVGIALRGVAEDRWRDSLNPGEHKSRTLQLPDYFRLVPGKQYSLSVETFFAPNFGPDLIKRIRVDGLVFSTPPRN